MKKAILYMFDAASGKLVPAAAAPAAATSAAAPAGADGAALLQKNGCLACHAIDKKVVGPSYKEVAAKYGADKNAAAMLAQKVKAGSAGVWGQVPMPPNAQVSDADLQVITKYILALK
jgi:cytochrome c